MLNKIFGRLFGTRHERERRRVQPIIAEIVEIEKGLAALSNEEIQGQTAKFRAMLAERTGPIEERIDALKTEKRTATSASERERIDTALHGVDGRGGADAELRSTIAAFLDEILPEAFATVREACRRLTGSKVIVTGNELSWDMVPYEVQLIGGIQLHLGRIAEMATGEGKTLVATLPLYLNAIPGRGAHLVTVNNYLARRDSQWMGHLYRWLGLTVGCLDDTEPGSWERREVYGCDITYGTNNEFGFDYLRDNMVTTLEQRVQRQHIFAMIDEVDSILVDEARTPLIISGPVGNDGDLQYAEFNNYVVRLVRRQSDLVNTLVANGERALEAKDTATAGLELYKAQLGWPKNKKLMKILQEPGVKQLVQRMELDRIADRKLPASKQAFRDLEDDLLFVLDEKGHTVHLTEQGLDWLSPDDRDAFVLPDIATLIGQLDKEHELGATERLERRNAIEREYATKSERLNIIHQLLRAHALYEKDVNYVVQEGQVLIVDEFTGRTMPGRRWSEGLHQAVEAKESVQVKGETQTLATITIQNYFRMYEKLAGMTGTAETEENEFHQIYGLEVSVIPTNRPIARDDRQDLVFKTRREKYNAIVEETKRLHELGYPVLVGTASVEASETLARLFARAGLKHSVLNAKYHQREAEIVAEAGRAGAITIATNMAGRGTDIKLGPNTTESRPSTMNDPDGKSINVDEIGGLHIVGSERHESRRIDRQLRGRAGRQGDPGASQFFLSLEDDLMRLFGSERIAKLMDRMGAQDGEVLTHPLITRSIEQAQKRVELQNFQSRKRLLEYDDVMNQQREVIYSLRAFALEGGEELKAESLKLVERGVQRRVEQALSTFDKQEDWDFEYVQQDLLMHFMLQVPEFTAEPKPATIEDAQGAAATAALQAFDAKLESLNAVTDESGQGFADRLLALIMLNVLDEKWKDHLYDLDQLRASIHYRSWGQKDPLVEYKQDAYTMFVDLMHDLANTFTERFLKAQLVFEQAPAPTFQPPVAPIDSRLPDGRPAKRFNAMGILEDVPYDEVTAIGGPASASFPEAESEIAEAVYEDDGIDETTAPAPQVARSVTSGMPSIVGAGPVRSLDAAGGTLAAGWESTPRNNACPCGSGKKFKKCHGANL
ncbi:MAG: preprotein translocase subunit SecA [Gemmatimonadaceae bacterium]|nr:preprotein translocase subunit SecA [Gemmatimonadaceae bacterium]